MNTPWQFYHLKVEPDNVWFYPRVPLADFARYCTDVSRRQKIDAMIGNARLQSVTPEIRTLIQHGSAEEFNRYAREVRLRFCREYHFAEEESAQGGHCFCSPPQSFEQFCIGFRDDRIIDYPLIYCGVFLNRANYTYGMPHPLRLPTMLCRVVNFFSPERRNDEL